MNHILDCFSISFMEYKDMLYVLSKHVYSPLHIWSIMITLWFVTVWNRGVPGWHSGWCCTLGTRVMLHNSHAWCERCMWRHSRSQHGARQVWYWRHCRLQKSKCIWKLATPKTCKTEEKNKQNICYVYGIWTINLISMSTT